MNFTAIAALEAAANHWEAATSSRKSRSGLLSFLQVISTQAEAHQHYGQYQKRNNAYAAWGSDISVYGATKTYPAASPAAAAVSADVGVAVDLYDAAHDAVLDQNAVSPLLAM